MLKKALRSLHFFILASLARQAAAALKEVVFSSVFGIGEVRDAIGASVILPSAFLLVFGDAIQIKVISDGRVKRFFLLLPLLLLLCLPASLFFTGLRIEAVCGLSVFSFFYIYCICTGRCLPGGVRCISFLPALFHLISAGLVLTLHQLNVSDSRNAALSFLLSSLFCSLLGILLIPGQNHRAPHGEAQFRDISLSLAPITLLPLILPATLALLGKEGDISIYEYTGKIASIPSLLVFTPAFEDFAAGGRGKTPAVILLGLAAAGTVSVLSGRIISILYGRSFSPAEILECSRFLSCAVWGRAFMGICYYLTKKNLVEGCTEAKAPVLGASLGAVLYALLLAALSSAGMSILHSSVVSFTLTSFAILALFLHLSGFR